MNEQKYMPIRVTKADTVLGGRVDEILPPMAAIPKEFHSMSNQWAKWQADWFYSGLKRLPVPKEGIDLNMAMGNLAAVQGSFEPKHEHKSAGVAYLASLWFDGPDGQELPPRALPQGAPHD
jgi:anti-sigma factor ChrR (cupin superfamily)